MRIDLLSIVLYILSIVFPFFSRISKITDQRKTVTQSRKDAEKTHRSELFAALRLCVSIFEISAKSATTKRIP